MEKTSKELANRIENSMSASFWLKKAIVTAQGRDPVDMVRDAELLLLYCKQRLAEVQKGIY